MTGQLNTSVSVVVLNWNKAGLTRNALSVARSPTRCNPYWVVVDNGSREPIDNLPPDITVLRNEKLGLRRRGQHGIRCAIQLGADYIWLLNNDAEPLPGTLDTLIEAAESDSKIGFTSPAILNSDQADEID